MKQGTWTVTCKTFITFLLLCCVQTIIWAQDSTSSTTSTSSSTERTIENSENWYASPWVWIVGAALFILLLVALTRGGSSRRTTDATNSDRITVTKSVRRDTDVDTDV